MSHTFYCSVCDYKTTKKSNYLKHMNSAKHAIKTSAKNQEVCQEYSCQACNYTTNYKVNYTKHLKTSKHKKKIREEAQEEDDDEDDDEDDTHVNEYFCNFCHKKYIHRSSCWKHQQTCKKMIGTGTQIVDPSIVMELLKTNMEFRQMFMTQSQQISTILDSVSNGTIANNSHNTNNSNNRFNINIFLNEQCKDAMNIEDFVESIDFTLDDLEETGKHGYVKGISRIITNKLKSMDMFSRPLHCTDAKRETLYIKEENNWKKDDEQHTMFRNVIAEVAEKNEGMIEEWKETHPLCTIAGTKETDQIMDIYYNTMTGSNEENDKFNKKIIKNVLKEVMITKDIVV
jgi:hypothetical protein